MLTGVGATFTYDEANRIVSATPTSGGTESYGYSPDNKRIFRLPASGPEEFTLYGGFGEKIGTYGWYDPLGNGSSGMLLSRNSNVWFAGSLIWNEYTN
jgi:hypothetical protein